jgi:MarR family 2-MHQ and catechol resistance regulon transcriptional repressor
MQKINTNLFKNLAENLPDKEFSKLFMYGMHQIYVLVQRHMEKVLSESKTLTFSQFWVLVCFVSCDGVTASDVAKKMYITEATLSLHIKRLLAQKFISKKKDKHNARKYIIHLTDKGKNEYDKAHKIVEQEMQKIFKVVSVEDRKNIITNFDIILNNLTNN